MERKSFVLYQSYEEQINCLPPEERGLLFSAIFEFFRTGELSAPLPFGANIIFIGIREGLKRDLEKYEKMCERNKENAKRGGRPKKNQSVFEKPYNDNDNGNDNGNGNDNENDNDNDNGGGNENELTEPQSAPLPIAPHLDAPLPLAPPPDAPLPIAPHAPRKREEEKEELINLGIPRDYIDEREERAEDFAKKQKKSFVDVFMEWWSEDKTSFERKRELDRKNGVLHSKEKSYDTDAFFEAALRKSYEEFDKRYGGDMES